MDKKDEPKQAEELPEPLEEYEPEPLLKSKNTMRTGAKIGRPPKSEEEKLRVYREGRDRINVRRNEQRRIANEEKALKIAEEAKQKKEIYEEEVFQRKLKQKEERDRKKAEEAQKKAEEEETRRMLELEKEEKALLIKRIKELESKQPKPTAPSVPLPPPVQTPDKPKRKPARLYL